MSPAYHLPNLGRLCAPAETVARVRPHAASLGVTRLASQTGLDCIGIPVWAAMRPNSLTLAVNQGKGIDDDAACASALMEAAEYAIAERPDASIRVATPAELSSAGENVFIPYRQMPSDACISDKLELVWLEARRLHDGGRVWVPYEAARLDHTQDVFGGMTRSSNGLASGNDWSEAALHAICELVERDAKTLAGLRSSREVERSRIDPAAFRNCVIDQLSAQIGDAGFDLGLYDQTTDIRIPVIQAVIQNARFDARQQLDLAAGSGCHPFAAHAAVRAITEAAQTRITNISGARDDINPSEYREPLRKGLDVYLSKPQRAYEFPPPTSLAFVSPTPNAMLEAIKLRLFEAGIGDVILASLGGTRYGIEVIKAFAPGLEDRPVNRHWRPGTRVAKALMRLW